MLRPELASGLTEKQEAALVASIRSPEPPPEQRNVRRARRRVERQDD